MTIHLDHTIVPARARSASAQRLAELLGVPGPKAARTVRAGLRQRRPDARLHRDRRRLSDLSLLLSRRRRRVRRHPRPHPGRGHRLPQQRARPGRHADQHRLRRPHDLLERSRGAPVGTSHGQLRAAGAMTCAGRRRMRRPAPMRRPRSTSGPTMRIHRLLAAALALASATVAAQDRRYDPKALARYDVSYMRCEAAFPEMKGHRDDAYLSLWRIRPGPKRRRAWPRSATARLQGRAAARRPPQRRRERAGRRQGARAPMQGPLGRDAADAEAGEVCAGLRRVARR